ncbi:hypothetical protein V500_07904 [Pseudogymnoascus sp. VKM F-4518 (FW-2643)]|nr:hypothetical protein V500_07904 [Pseudogymnoascus sp. VKM F-4518 (FW-2643)]
MDPAVKNPDLKVQEPTLLPTIYESQTEDAFKPTATASEVTEARTRQTTTREASIPETPSSTTTPQVPASKDQGQVQAQVEAGKESSVPRLFSLAGKVIVVTGGARGIGLSMSESLIECGTTVHALDLLPIPSPEFDRLAASLPKGTLTYHPIDILDLPALDTLITSIADKHSGLHGLIAAAGIQHEAPALTYSAEICNRVLAVNITGVMSSAQVVARAMLAHGTPGSITLIASMSGTIANRGLPCAAYNASKAGSGLCGDADGGGAV